MNRPILHLPSVHFSRGAEIWNMPIAKYSAFEAGFKRLSRRSLLMASAEDVVIVDGAVSQNYISLLNDCGAGGKTRIVPSKNSGACLAEDCAASPEVAEFIRRWDGEFETYMATPMETMLGELTGKRIINTPPGVAELLNDKIFFLRLLEDLDLPRIPTFAGVADAVGNRIKFHITTPHILRGAQSVGGTRVWGIRTKAEREKAFADISKRDKKGLFILQPLLNMAMSPNLQFYITDDRVHLFGESVQILTRDMEHTGNVIGPVEDTNVRDQLIDQGSALALEAASVGYRGVLGLDFIVTTDGHIYAVELNARHNTSTHAIWFINRLATGDPFTQIDFPAAFMRISTDRERHIDEWITLLGDDLFDPKTAEGILPHDTGGTELCALVTAKSDGKFGKLKSRIGL